jgi:hypothetical protein
MMKDAHYLFAEWLTLMARWLAVGADRDRIAGRAETERRAGRTAAAKQTAVELTEAQRKMDALEAKLRVVQAAREDLAANVQGLSGHA